MFVAAMDCEEYVAIYKETYGSSSKQYTYFDKDVTNLNRRQHPAIWSLTSFKKIFKSAFLPKGYPESVSKDYTQYQLWDSLQAFVSRLMGTLSTQAVLKGIGVGNEYATPLAATITWLIRDGTSNVARIWFTWYESSALDCNSKQWRLFADIMNDVAFGIDLLATHVGMLSTPFLCMAGIFRATVDAAGGATRAAFVQHQARRNNLADVSAKDGSQETVVNLAGLITSLFLVNLIGNHEWMIFLLYFLFCALHLFANYKAVKSLSMETLNQLRLSILVQRFIENPTKLPNVEETNAEEPVIPGTATVKINLGCSIKRTTEFLPSLKVAHSLYGEAKYILAVDPRRREVFITLKKHATQIDELESSFHAHVILHSFKHKPGKFLEGLNIHDQLHFLTQTKKYTQGNFGSFVKQIKNQGWNVQNFLLGADEWRAEWDVKDTST